MLLRATLFFVCASAVWALLPLVARQLLDGGAGFYGLLLGAVGAGAIVGAILLPRIRGAYRCRRHHARRVARHRRRDRRARCRAAAVAAAVILLLILGSAWIAALTTLNGTIAGDPAELGARPRPRDLSDGLQRRARPPAACSGASSRRRSASTARCSRRPLALVVVALRCAAPAAAGGRGRSDALHPLAGARHRRAGRA